VVMKGWFVFSLWDRLIDAPADRWAVLTFHLHTELVVHEHV